MKELYYFIRRFFMRIYTRLFLISTCWCIKALQWMRKISITSGRTIKSTTYTPNLGQLNSFGIYKHCGVGCRKEYTAADIRDYIISRIKTNQITFTPSVISCLHRSIPNPIPSQIFGSPNNFATFSKQSSLVTAIGT